MSYATNKLKADFELGIMSVKQNVSLNGLYRGTTRKNYEKMYPATAKNYDGSPMRYYKCITTKKRDCFTYIIDKNY